MTTSRCLVRLLLVVLVFWGGSTSVLGEPAAGPLRVHPTNPLTLKDPSNKD